MFAEKKTDEKSRQPAAFREHSIFDPGRQDVARDFIFRGFSCKFVFQRQVNMSSYTFIANFKGGVFVRQVGAKNILLACRIWADELAHKRDIPDLNVSKFLKDFNNDLKHLPPVPLQNTPNVWCFTVGTGRNFILVNIVKTSSEKEPAPQYEDMTAAGSIR